jgi:hypothetical protein
MKTISDIREEKKLSAPKSVTTKEILTFSKFPETACVIPVGTKLEVHFSGVNHDRLYYEYNGSVRVSAVKLAHKKFTGFNKPPGLNTLQKYDYNGIAKTPTGYEVEPDGTGPDGSPSWLLVLGLM